MNTVKALCGHSIPAIGEPRSPMRLLTENSRCRQCQEVKYTIYTIVHTDSKRTLSQGFEDEEYAKAVCEQMNISQGRNAYHTISVDVY